MISCGFDLPFLMITNVEHFFIYLLSISLSSFEECLQVFCSFFNQLIGRRC
jgi:hypothetical protein